MDATEMPRMWMIYHSDDIRACWTNEFGRQSHTSFTGSIPTKYLLTMSCENPTLFNYLLLLRYWPANYVPIDALNLSRLYELQSGASITRYSSANLLYQSVKLFGSLFPSFILSLKDKKVIFSGKLTQLWVKWVRSVGETLTVFWSEIM